MQTVYSHSHGKFHPYTNALHRHLQTSHHYRPDHSVHRMSYQDATGHNLLPHIPLRQYLHTRRFPHSPHHHNPLHTWILVPVRQSGFVFRVVLSLISNTQKLFLPFQ